MRAPETPDEAAHAVRALCEAGQAWGADTAALAAQVDALAEPWADASRDGHFDIFWDERHAALHGLMHAALRAGDLDAALAIRRRDDAGAARAANAVRALGLDRTSGAEVLHGKAYGNEQLIAPLAAAGRHDDVASCLDAIEAAARMAAEIGDAGACDAVGAHEIIALGRAAAGESVPGALAARCRARLAGLEREADAARPRMRAAFAADREPGAPAR